MLKKEPMKKKKQTNYLVDLHVSHFQGHKDAFCQFKGRNIEKLESICLNDSRDEQKHVDER